MGREVNRRWWTEPETKRHEALVATEKHLRTAMGPWFQKFARFERAYTGVRLEGLTGVGRAQALSVGPTATKKLPAISDNVIKSIIDTKTAKITGVTIRPVAVTDGASWGQMRQAKKLTKFTDGLFYENEMRVRAPSLYKRSRIVGTSCVKTFKKRGRPAVEITDIMELRVDPQDALHGAPRMLVQVKPIHRDVVRESFPKPVTPTAITGAKRIETRKGESAVADMIEVFEGWHLPSGDDADDGVHVICTTAGTLFEEPWKEDDFPFVFMRGDERLFGFWGIGDAEDLEGNQEQLDKTNKTIQRANHLGSIPGYYVPNSSEIPTGAFNNEVGRIVRGEGPNPPQQMPGINIPPALMQERNDLRQGMFQNKGVSEAAAASQVPAGITGSGEAQRVYADTQTERFNVEAKEYEQFHIRLAKKLIKLARTIAEENDGKFSVKVPGRRFMETIDLKEIDLDDEDFDMQIQSSSSLPKDLTGKLAAVKDLLQGGFIDDPKTEGRRMLDLPDIDSFTDLALAEYDYAHSEIERILDGKKPRPLVPYADYAVCVKWGRKHWLAAHTAGAPMSILVKLDQWIAQAGAKLKQMQAQAAAAAPAAAPGPAGMGRPAVAPTSNLMPATGAAPAA
jgi:hypothetical protein